MNKKLLAGLAASAGMALLALSPAHAQELREINFGIISTESSQNLRQDWQPILDDMAKKTGIKVNAFFAPDYAGIIEGMRFNKVHVAWFGNKSAMEAVDRASGEVFAQMVNADGTQGYYSHLIAHKDSPIKTLDDVLKNGKSLTFGNGDPNSTSGFLVPGYYGVHDLAVAVDLVQRRTVFIGDEEVAGAWVDDDAFRIERHLQRPGHRGCQAVQRVAALAEDQRLEHLEVRDLAASAEALARLDLLDIFSSDYVPASLLLSAFLLHHKVGWTLPKAINTVTRNPARAIGLNDRGEVAAGQRADLIRVRISACMPIVMGTLSRGLRAH